MKIGYLEQVHYGETREEFASRVGKHPSCFEDIPRAFCGNGSYHAKTTRDVAKVTCISCLNKIDKRNMK